jgi:hypothetical protein
LGNAGLILDKEAQEQTHFDILQVWTCRGQMFILLIFSKDRNPSRLSENMSWLQEKPENTSEKQTSVLLEEKGKSKLQF